MLAINTYLLTEQAVLLRVVPHVHNLADLEQNTLNVRRVVRSASRLLVLGAL